ncbi:helix-turn-helix domain-containing protein [Actinospica robiniae]|uniref:helix-turn-helix domain-containing protein n=1 Tax=Actinospica robiniae TaxID=304901 RepID=UPI0012FB9110|nr:helix-turn-helix domain-containing protein [Actinospica robiniae]
MDPAGGVVERFACELRALRAAAGELPFWKMALRCDASKSALAAAVAGHELPSEHVMAAFVRACGGEAQWWSKRLAQARSELDAELFEAAPEERPQHATGAELVLASPLPPVRALEQAYPVPRAAFVLSRSDPAARPRPRAQRRMAGLPLLGVSLALGAAAAISLSLYGHRAPTPVVQTETSPTESEAAAGGGPFVYDQTTGPGCIMVFAAGQHEQVAQVEPENSVDLEHAWVATTSHEPHWSIPDCTNAVLYSQPSTEANRYQWQNDYVWKFFDVPSGVPCTFHIYIADSPLSKYNATYDWTNGVVVGDWVDANAFTIDQATYTDSWYTDAPHGYTTGMAYLMLTDQRGDNLPSANAPLTASEVRLTCTP